MKSVEPIVVIDLFEPLLGHLLDLLRRIAEQDWDRSTPCQGWTVKDIALQLLGDEIGQLSRGRDKDTSSILPPGPDLVSRINAQNQLWVAAARRMSPRLLCEAVGQPGLTEATFLTPVLDTFVRALPWTLRGVSASEGTTVELNVIGDAGNQWFLVRQERRCSPFTDHSSPPITVVRMKQETAWRLFTKGMVEEKAMVDASIEGNRAFAEALFGTVAILAGNILFGSIVEFSTIPPLHQFSFTEKTGSPYNVLKGSDSC